MSKRILTENQEKFLDALFSPEGKGDPSKAMKLAGYAETTRTFDVVNSLRAEILERAQAIMAMNTPRAAMELVGLFLDPNQNGAMVKIKAIQEVLNRTGLSAKENQDINLKVPEGGLVLLPAKEMKKEVEDDV